MADEKNRSVKLPNGHTYTNVPDHVSDSDAWEIWKSQNGVDTRQLELKEPEEELSEEAPVVSGQDKVKPSMGMYSGQLANLRSLQGEDTPEPKSYGEMAEDTKAEAHAVKIDFGRLFADTKSDLANLAKYGMTQYGEAVGAISSEQKEILQSPEMSSVVTKAAAEPIARAINEDVRTLYDPTTGRIFPMDTAIGTTAEVGTYLYGGIKSFKNLPDLLSKSKVWRNNFFKSTGAGVIVDQLLTNPDQNISTMFKEALGETAAKEFDKYLLFATDKDDSESIKRLKLIGEGATIGAIIDTIMLGAGKANQFRKFIKTKFNKTPEQLTKEDKGTLLVDYAREQKEIASKGEWKDPYFTKTGDDLLEDAASIRNLQEQPELRFNETPEGEAQVRMQQSSFLRRLFQGTFTSRGYWTPRAYDAFNDSLYAQRATVNEAEVISRKFNTLLKNFSDQDPDVLSKVNKAFNEKLDDPSSPFLDQVENIAKNYDLPEELAAQVLEGRNFIDQLSDRLMTSSMVDGNLKEIIQENLGSYIRRSFRLFEDKNYKPSDEIKEEAIDFITQRYMNEGALPDLAEQTARLNVDEILNKGDMPALEHLASVRKLNNNIFKAKGDIPEPIRKLMGEIQEADESFLLTAQKMAKFAEDSRFYDNLLRLGEGKYIFKVARSTQSDVLPGTEIVPSVEPKLTITGDADEVLFDTDIYNTKISGTGSQLDFGINREYDYYTTPEIATALKGEQGFGSFKSTGSLQFLDTLGRGFLSLKGFSQKNKTVYSIVTQARNVNGGFQFGLANGVNPFGREATQTFKVLLNQSKQSDTALNELYQDYQRLGIINTNATINEFRALLDTGMDADENILVALNNKLKGYGLTESVAKAVDPALTKVTGFTDKFIANPMEATYLGVDDFFKIVNYNSELNTLKKAYPNSDFKTLEAEAARKIRATIPNYDFVPPNVKALRYLPLGSFVSFPAEIVRTTAGIYREAFKEMSSDNATLRLRGAKRFAGRTAMAGAWYGASQAMGSLLGFNKEQIDSIQTADERPWSTVSPRLPLIIDDKIYTIDTQFLNAYETTNAPFELLYEEVKNGTLKGDSLDEAIVNAGFKAIGDIISPYVDQPIFTQAISDVTYAMFSSDGRTPNGTELFNSTTPTMEKFENGVYHVLESFVPGGAFQIEELLNSDAFLEKPNPHTGKVKPTNLELVALFTGIRLTELDPEISFGYRISEFNGRVNDANRIVINYEKKPEEIVEDYINIEKVRYKNTQELYRQFLATKELIGLAKTIGVLDEKNVPDNVIMSLISGKFYNPREALTDINTINIFQKTPFDSKSELNSVGKLTTALTNEYVKMLNTNLYFEKENLKPDIGDPTRKEDEFIDLKLAKGGEVYNVPQVPVEPDERIDKMTGLPYDQQAGEAFIDQEDRTKLENVSRFPFADDGRNVRGDFNTGGKILGSLSRTRKAEGGKPPHRGYFKPVKELLIDNKDKEFVKRILNPALNDTLKRDKSVASNETHRMAAEVDEKGNWYVFPNVINKEGTLTKSKNPMKAALDNNEYISFGKDKDQALWFAADNYKTQEFRDHHK